MSKKGRKYRPNSYCPSWPSEKRKLLLRAGLECLLPQHIPQIPAHNGIATISESMNKLVNFFFSQLHNMYLRDVIILWNFRIHLNIYLMT